jgi:16S rRNA (uracil1498-N3)-methyltransferase
MHRFYAPASAFENGLVILALEETRHLRDVLRLREGSTIQVFDGAGREFRCRITGIGKRSSNAEIVEEIEPESPESGLELTLASSMLKGEKFDLVVQKAVELGVTRLIPINTRRCDVKMKDGAARTERWRRIAFEASKQSGRARLMEVDEPSEFEKTAMGRNSSGTQILFSERNGKPFPKSIDDKKVTAFIGPEGGWDDAELEFAAANGISVVTLGGRILRAETASIALTAILQHRFGDLN